MPLLPGVLGESWGAVSSAVSSSVDAVSSAGDVVSSAVSETASATVAAASAVASAVTGTSSSSPKVPCKVDLDNCFAVAIPKGGTGLGACSSCKAYKDSITAVKHKDQSPISCDGDFIAGDWKWFNTQYTFDIESGCGACPKGLEPIKMKQGGKHIYCAFKDGRELKSSLYCDHVNTKQLMGTPESMCSGPVVRTLHK